MARKGAEHKYEELKAEIASLVRHFPHLTGRQGGMARGVAALSKGGKAVMEAVSGEAPRKRRKMSAKARKAISDAQKKRWAAKKGTETASAKKAKK
jgi:hypothetical protein